MRYWTIAFALSAAVLAFGCSAKTGPKTATVKGKVTLDGAPLPAGKIIFDEGPSVPAADLEIKDGQYSGQATVGKKTVRISVPKFVPPPKGMSGGAYEKGMEQESLPARYNSASTDVREVKEGANDFDFDVKSR